MSADLRAALDHLEKEALRYRALGIEHGIKSWRQTTISTSADLAKAHFARAEILRQVAWELKGGAL